MRRSALALLLPLAACAQPAPPEVKDVWARDSVGGVANAAIYMTISARGGDRLLGASTPAAKKTDLMTMESGDGGAMGMKYVKHIEIPAGQPVSLEPTGLHVWLEGLNAPLKAGQSFALTLKFEKAGEKQVSVSVIAPAAAAPMQGMKM